MNEQYVMIGCVFGAVALVGYFVTRLVMGNGEGEKLRDRLTSDGDDTLGGSAGFGGAGGGPSVTDGAAAATGMMPLLQKMGQAAAEPFMPKNRENQSSLRKRLGYAGIYSAGAMKVMTGAKVICLVGGLFGGYAVGAAFDMLVLGISVGGLVGYIAPTIWLKLRVKANQQALNYGLPDALDLMVVCVEAGLTIDSAMQRVGQELGLAHPALSREFGIAHMETRVGLSRSESLKNLATRTGSQALQSLAAMLIQADRFGTSIASALRIHADSLRTHRQHLAEEMAAKASVKMSFPLVLFIFPATFIVLAGPTVIGLMHSALFQ
jgi:tight adherence protein C